MTTTANRAQFSHVLDLYSNELYAVRMTLILQGLQIRKKYKGHCNFTIHLKKLALLEQMWEM